MWGLLLDMFIMDFHALEIQLHTLKPLSRYVLWQRSQAKLGNHFLCLKSLVLRTLNYKRVLRLSSLGSKEETIRLHKSTTRASFGSIHKPNPFYFVLTQHSYHLTLDLISYSCPFHKKSHKEASHLLMHLREPTHRMTKKHKVKTTTKSTISIVLSTKGR
jgi:hypothetical protein